MAFDYLEFWKDSEKAERLNKFKAFEDKTKNDKFANTPNIDESEIIPKGNIFVCDNRHDARQRPRDLNAFFLKRERATLKEIKQKA